MKSVEDGNRALEALESEGFDFILTDLMMPGADGWEVLERAKEIYPQVNVVIVTAHGTRNTETIAKKRGAYGYVEKPEIIDKVKMLLENSRNNSPLRSGTE